MATKLPKLQGSEERENKNCGNQVAENGRKERERERELWQPSCRKLGEKFNSNLGNEVAKNEGKKEEDLGQKLKRKKKLWQLMCGNGIVEMEGKEDCFLHSLVSYRRITLLL